MNKLLIVCMATLMLAGCKRDDEAGAPSAKIATKGSELASQLDKIAAATIAAQSNEHFAQILMDCGLVLMAAEDQAASVSQDARFIEVCKVNPTKARARLAISESTADDMSVHCLTSSMNIEDLIQEGVATKVMSKLMAEVKTACRL